MMVSPDPPKLYSEGTAAPADDGPALRVPLLGSWLSQLITANPCEGQRELVLSEVISARILGTGFKPLRQFGLVLPQGWHLFTLSKVQSVMSFCVHLEAVDRLVAFDDVKGGNSKRSFRSGHVPSDFELLNLSISPGSCHCLCKYTLTGT